MVQSARIRDLSRVSWTRGGVSCFNQLIGVVFRGLPIEAAFASDVCGICTKHVLDG